MFTVEKYHQIKENGTDFLVVYKNKDQRVMLNDKEITFAFQDTGHSFTFTHLQFRQQFGYLVPNNIFDISIRHCSMLVETMVMLSETLTGSRLA